MIKFLLGGLVGGIIGMVFMCIFQQVKNYDKGDGE